MRQTSHFRNVVCTPLVVCCLLPALPSRAEPPITISKETTYITEPLRDDGLPDYERYLRERFSQGVTPENNAAVLFWQAMGPGDSEPEEFAAVAKAIGMTRIPTKEEALQSVSIYGSESLRKEISNWLQERGVLPPKPANDNSDDSPWENQNYESVAEVLELAKAQPWTAAEIPPLGKWITRNQKPLELLVESSTRTRFYSPEPAWVNDKRDSLISAMWIQEIQATRDAVSTLVTRAMFHLGEGQFDSAWRDLLAAHRLTRLWDRHSGFLVDELVAKACMNEAQVATRVLLADPRLPADQARQIFDDLTALDPPKSGSDTFDIGERVFTLDLLLTLMEDRLDPLAAQMLEDAIQIEASGPVDWNVILTEVNRRYDLFLAATNVADRTKRKRELEKLLPSQPDLDAKALASLDRNQRSIAFAATFDPADESASWGLRGPERILTHIDFNRLAAALAVYRAEYGRYPKRLEDLVPNLVNNLHVDAYHETPYVYRRTENGYLLYTKGENGKDDGGSDRDFLEVYRGYPVDLKHYDSVRTLLGSDTPELLATFNPATAKRSERTWESLSPLYDHIPDDADDIAIRVPLPKLMLPMKAE